MTKEQGLLAAVKRWAAAGYTASATAIAFNLTRQTVKRVAYADDNIRFGPKRLPAKWVAILEAKAGVPPNLEGQYELFGRHMAASPDWTLEQLTGLLPDVSADRVTDWWVLWANQRRIRTELQMLDYKLSKKLWLR